MNPLHLAWGGASDVGMVRQGNEDALLAEHGVFVVADGMGGHNAGEVASELAVTTMRSALRDSVSSTEQLRELVQQANTTIYTASLDDSTQRGMGTTLTTLVMIPGVTDRVLVANVGDSRTYVLRNGQLSRITTDHSYVQELVNEGVITPDDARKHPQKNIVTRALGIDRYVAVDVFSHDVQPGDRFLLCSDGLVDEVTDIEITEILDAHKLANDAAVALIEKANALGGRDNTTVIVVDVLEKGAEGGTSFNQPTNAASAGSETGGRDPNSITGTLSATPPKKNKRHSFAYILISLVIVVGVFTTTAIVGVYARSGYFIGTDSDSVVTVYRGRVGGVWWFHPTVEVQSQLRIIDVPIEVVRDLRANRSFSSLAEAQQYLVFVETAVTTTTTTIASTDTVDPLISTTTIG